MNLEEVQHIDGRWPSWLINTNKRNKVKLLNKNTHTMGIEAIYFELSKPRAISRDWNCWNNPKKWWLIVVMAADGMNNL